MSLGMVSPPASHVPLQPSQEAHCVRTMPSWTTGSNSMANSFEQVPAPVTGTAKVAQGLINT